MLAKFASLSTSSPPSEDGTIDYGHSHNQASIKEMPHKLASKPIWQGEGGSIFSFENMEKNLFSSDSGLCQAGETKQLSKQDEALVLTAD